MKCFFSMLMIASACAAQVSPEEAMRRLEERRAARGTEQATPSSRPVLRDPAELHAEAVSLMLAGQYPKAAPLLDQARNRTPTPDRALVLNRAMLDLRQRVNVMRGVKDLTAYLKPGDPDETAVDLLGACLSLARKNPRITQNAVYQAGEKQLAASVGAVERTRPGERKWGNQWMSDKQFVDIKKQLEQAERDRRDAQARADAVRVKLAEANAEIARHNVITFGGRHAHKDRLHGPSSNCGECGQIRTAQVQLDNARKTAVAIEQEYISAKRAVEDVVIPQPQWPTEFQPIQPNTPTTNKAE